KYAYQILDTPCNKRRVISTRCEIAIVREAASEPNRRMLFARVCNSLLQQLNCTGAVRQAVVFLACTLAIVVQCEQMTRYRRANALQDIQRQLERKEEARAAEVKRREEQRRAHRERQRAEQQRKREERRRAEEERRMREE